MVTLLSNHAVRYLAVVFTALGNLAIIAAALMFLAAPVKAVTDPFSITVTITGGGSTAFTPLHTYYVAPTSSPPAGWNAGSDSNNGTSKSSPWATINHAANSPSGFPGFVCGDVVIVAPATYTTGFTLGQNPGTCPSTPTQGGGIDGQGGIYFVTVLCGGTDINSCFIHTTLGNGPGFEVLGNNWAIEGFKVDVGCIVSGGGTSTNCSDGDGYASYRWRDNIGCGGGAINNVIHHGAVINSISQNSGSYFEPNNCGAVGALGADYMAIVGGISFSSNQDTICIAAIDGVGLGKLDANAGTHVFFHGNFGINNQSPACATSTDGEFMMIDTPQVNTYSGTTVFSNNIGFESTRFCIQLLTYSADGVALKFNVYNNTCFQNNVGTNHTGEGDDGEFNYHGSNDPWVVNIYNNVILSPTQHNGVGGVLYAYDDIGGTLSGGTVNNGAAVGSGLNNVYFGFAATCVGTGNSGGCDAGDNINSWIPGHPDLGTNTYINPSFTSTADLLANHLTAPNCAGFVTTTACMGWNANTSTLTANSVISDLVANCVGCTGTTIDLVQGKGYQLPSTTCVASGSFNTDFPVWLKGIVYLQWNSSTGAITQNHDLVTTPCGL